MKRVLAIITFIVALTTTTAFAQKLTYQAVIRDNNQQLVTNTMVSTQIIVNFSTGTPYDTTILKSTNIHGLLSLEFGNNTFASRDWTNATIKVTVKNANNLSIVYMDGDPTAVNAVPNALTVNGSSIQNYLDAHHYLDSVRTIGAIRDTAAVLRNLIKIVGDDVHQLKDSVEHNYVSNTAMLYYLQFMQGNIDSTSRNVRAALKDTASVLRSLIHGAGGDITVLNRKVDSLNNNMFDTVRSIRSALNTRIDTLSANSINRDNALSTRIHNDSLRLRQDSTELADRMTAINIALSNRIVADSNRLTRDSAFLHNHIDTTASAIRSSLAAETAARISADDILRTDLTAETTARMQADSAIYIKIKADSTTQRDALRDTASTLRSLIRGASGDVTALNRKIDSLNSNMFDTVRSVRTALNTRIDTTAANAYSRDLALGVRIDTTSSQIRSALVDTAKAIRKDMNKANSTLSARIDTNYNRTDRRIKADSLEIVALYNNTLTLVKTKISADSALLEGKITANATNIATNTSNIATNKQAIIDTAAALRKADSAINKRIDTLTAGTTTALVDTAKAIRKDMNKADSTLSARIDTNYNKIDRRIIKDSLENVRVYTEAMLKLHNDSALLAGRIDTTAAQSNIRDNNLSARIDTNYNRTDRRIIKDSLENVRVYTEAMLKLHNDSALLAGRIDTTAAQSNIRDNNLSARIDTNYNRTDRRIKADSLEIVALYNNTLTLVKTKISADSALLEGKITANATNIATNTSNIATNKQAIIDTAAALRKADSAINKRIDTLTAGTTTALVDTAKAIRKDMNKADSTLSARIDTNYNKIDRRIIKDSLENVRVYTEAMLKLHNDSALLAGRIDTTAAQSNTRDNNLSARIDTNYNRTDRRIIKDSLENVRVYTEAMLKLHNDSALLAGRIDTTAAQSNIRDNNLSARIDTNYNRTDRRIKADSLENVLLYIEAMAKLKQDSTDLHDALIDTTNNLKALINANASAITTLRSDMNTADDDLQTQITNNDTDSKRRDTLINKRIDTLSNKLHNDSLNLAQKIRTDSTALAHKMSQDSTTLINKMRQDSTTLAEKISADSSVLATKIKADSTALAKAIIKGDSTVSVSIKDTVAKHLADGSSAINKAVDTITVNVVKKQLADATSAINLAVDTIADNAIKRAAKDSLISARELKDTASAIRNSISDSTITIKLNGDTVGLFTLNQMSNQTINVQMYQRYDKMAALTANQTGATQEFKLNKKPKANMGVTMIINSVNVANTQEGAGSAISLGGTDSKTITYTAANNGGKKIKTTDIVKFVYYTTEQ